MEARGVPSWREPGERGGHRLIPGAHENRTRKDGADPYQEPSLVPLAEKAKASWRNESREFGKLAPYLRKKGCLCPLRKQRRVGRSGKEGPTV